MNKRYDLKHMWLYFLKNMKESPNPMKSISYQNYYTNISPNPQGHVEFGFYRKAQHCNRLVSHKMLNNWNSEKTLLTAFYFPGAFSLQKKETMDTAKPYLSILSLLLFFTFSIYSSSALPHQLSLGALLYLILLVFYFY